MSYDIRIKSLYSDIGEDGARVLVDMTWPENLSSTALALTEWIPDTPASSGQVALMRLARQGRLTLMTTHPLPAPSLDALRNRLLAVLAEEDRQADGDTLSSPPCFLQDFDQ